jgi:flagellar operon protein
VSSLSIADLYRSGMVGGVEGRTSPSAKEALKKPGTPSEFQAEFQEVLNKENVKTANLQLSQHAESRIKSREIPWSADLERRIGSGIDQAEMKGSREALILADDVAVIANVKSRTVVTAMDRSQMKERIFTNIDSAVLV